MAYAARGGAIDGILSTNKANNTDRADFITRTVLFFCETKSTLSSNRFIYILSKQCGTLTRSQLSQRWYK